MKEFLIGDTIKLTWINSGVTPGTLTHALYDGSETMIGSCAMTNSGDGHYFGYCTVPNTPGLYVSETLAMISGYPFKRRRAFRAILQEVD